MIRQNLYIITGGMGFGKTTLIDSLCEMTGICKIPEFADEIIARNIEADKNFWLNRKDKLCKQSIVKLCEEIHEKRLDAYLRTSEDKIYFCDRGIPDEIAFLRFEKIKMPQQICKEIFEASSKYRYNQKIFIAPPWKEIYQNSSVREEPYENSIKLGNLIKGVYAKLNYLVIEIPKGSIKERVDFILNNL